MQPDTIPPSIITRLLDDAAQRDPVTARRRAIVALLLDERYLTREQVMMRVEAQLGKGVFGKAAWKDNFFRDMRAVKDALAAASFTLAYSRTMHKRGYFLRDQPEISERMQSAICTAIAEIDEQQLTVISRMTVAQRFWLGCSITDTARAAVAYRRTSPGRTPDSRGAG